MPKVSLGHHLSPFIFSLFYCFFLFFELFNHSIKKPLAQSYWKIVKFKDRPATMMF